MKNTFMYNIDCNKVDTVRKINIKVMVCQWCSFILQYLNKKGFRFDVVSIYF